MNLDKLLKEKNIRSTKIRKLVLNVLINSDVPLCVEEIYTLLKKEHKNVDLSTIYRTINLLEQKNIILKNTDINAIAFYQMNKDHHKHVLRCMKCNKKIVIDDCPLDVLEEDLSKSTGFKILNHNLEFAGICPDCIKKNENNN